MGALLKAIEDGVRSTFYFASKQDAERFKEFVNIYMFDSGAGNGYGAYWVLTDEMIVECDKAPTYAVTEVKNHILLSMLGDILNARTAGEQRNANGRMAGKKNGGITFNAGELLPRQRPQVGDMFRTIKEDGANEEEYAVGEGRVIADHGDTLEVINYSDEEDDGRIKPNAKRVIVRVANVMKINDWKKAHSF